MGYWDSNYRVHCSSESTDDDSVLIILSDPGDCEDWGDRSPLISDLNEFFDPYNFERSDRYPITNATSTSSPCTKFMTSNVSS